MSEFWINLASKDLPRAKEFYQKMGFKLNEQHQAPHMVSMFVGNKDIVLNLFTEGLMQMFMGQPVTEIKSTNEVLFSLGAASPQEVDALAERAVAAGGSLYAKPGYKDGWMYGCGFTDPDGHRWNILYMDFAKMPKAGN